MSLRVTFLVNTINLRTGGGSHYTLHLTASELCDLGFDVRIVVLQAADIPDAIDVPYRVVVEDGWDRSTRFSRFRSVAEILRRYEADTDVFHVASQSWGPAAGLYRSTGRVPVVITLNGYSMWCSNVDRMNGQCHRSCGPVQRVMHSSGSTVRRVVSLPVRVLEHNVAFPWVRHIDRFLPASPATRQVYAEAGFDMTNSTIIPDLIDFRSIRATVAERQQISSDGVGGAETGSARRLLYAGRLTPAKGVELLIDALPTVRANVLVDIAGDGPERAMLEARARALGVADRVTFHGWIPNRQLWDLQRDVDVIVHPGRWPEPCARSVLEALAHGIPTIVSNVGGPPWIVGEFGRTFRPGDAGDLAIQIDGLCADYDAAEAAAARGVERAATFDYRRWVPRIAEVYRAASEHRPVSAALGAATVGYGVL